MLVKPFRGLRPRADLVARIPSPPADAVDSDEARRLAKGDPFTFLHVVRPEIDLDPWLDPQDDRVYARARDNFGDMLARGWLVRDEHPAFYVVRLTSGGRSQVGVVGIVPVEDYFDGRIKRREPSRPEEEIDRARHADAISAQPGPVVLAHRGHARLAAVVEDIARGEPTAAFVAGDGVRHEMWRVVADETLDEIEACFAEIPAAYIAEGHHRAAAYARVGVQRRNVALRLSGHEPFQFLLAAHFPASDLRALDCGRLVRDLRGWDVGAFLDRVRAAGFEVRDAVGGAHPAGPGRIGMYLDATWRVLVPRPETIATASPASRLDVSVLSDRLLGPVLGIRDPRTDSRISYVGGFRDVREVTQRVDSGEFRVAFVLHPVGVEDLLAAADAGLLLPPKSTWLEPRLLSGMVVHVLDDAPVV